MYKFSRKILVAIALFLMLGVVWQILPAGTLDAYREAEILSEVRNTILANYVQDVSSEQLLEGALRGMFADLDEYSEYLDEQETSALFEETYGLFVGIGIELTQERGFLTVISPIEGSPAAEAGVLAGDRIVSIDSRPTEGIGLPEAVKMLRGEKGSRVAIGVRSKGESRVRTLQIVREVVHMYNIKDCAMLDEESKIGYLRLAKFNNNTAEALRAKVDELLAQGMESLIIDLRFNPGGVFKAAIDVVDCFVEEGVLVYTKGKNPKSYSEYRATAENTYSELPIVILVNEGSASASEIVAGALQDLGRALVIGVCTFGKGLVQSIFRLRDQKSAIKLTTAYYYTPKGRNIQRNEAEGRRGGIEPDHALPISVEEERRLALWFYRPDTRGEPLFVRFPESFAGQPAGGLGGEILQGVFAEHHGRLFWDRQLQKAADVLLDNRQ